MKVTLKGTKTRGTNWVTFISDSHFEPRTKEEIYGKVFTERDSEIWIHIYDKKTNELLDKSTWGFEKGDLIFEQTQDLKNKEYK